MKCIACGEENVQNARFCAFCGAKLSEGTPPPAAQEPTAAAPAADEEPVEQPAADPAPADQTARPLSDNPYQPPRSPVIPAAAPAAEAEAAHEPPSPRRIIQHAPQRVFLFDDEADEDSEKRSRQEKERAQKRVRVSGRSVYDEEDEFEEYDEYEEDEEDIYDEEDAPSGGRIFVRIFSVLTVLILIIGLCSFMYGTSIGKRLLASFRMSSSAEDYLLLADWQLAQGSLTDASASYYNAFKLDMENYELSLAVGTGFEKAGDDMRAEQLYAYLIEEYPQADEPYDRLMSLLIGQGRMSEYESLLLYRAERQPGYTPPSVTEPVTPNSSHTGGAYSAPLQLRLEAGGAPIYYTLDGSLPSASSTLYSGPITLEKGIYTIRAISMLNGKVSAEWSASFVVK